MFSYLKKALDRPIKWLEHSHHLKKVFKLAVMCMALSYLSLFINPVIISTAVLLLNFLS